MTHSFDFIAKSKLLRKDGFSYEEIGKKLDISKSTAFLWTKDIFLDKKAKERLKNREKMGLAKANEALSQKKELIIKKVELKVKEFLHKTKFDQTTAKLLCSFLYWAEGAKIHSNRVSFVNSDPIMIGTFIKLLRLSFEIDEKSFRCLVQLHDYHNEIEIKKFWSMITNIPLTQFNKSYRKKNTGKIKREGYKGCLQLNYYDWQIALEIRLIYNMLGHSITKGSW